MSLDNSSISVSYRNKEVSRSKGRTGRSVAVVVRKLLFFYHCSRDVIVLWLGGIVSVVCSVVLSEGSKPFM